MSRSMRNGVSPQKEPGNGTTPVYTEATPLLTESSDANLLPHQAERDGPSEPVPGRDDDGPMDKFQIFVLCYCRIADPVSFFCIIPFINQMIFDMGEYAESDVGFYTGLIESLFSVTQMLTMIPWGRIADRYGRKPVLVTSLWGMVFTVSLFGFSQNIWQMVLLRCAAGLFSGSVVTIRTMISENSTQKTQATAFSIFAFFGNLGIFLGPLIGGLAKPAEQYKSVFGGVKFWHEYPYALPTLISGVFVLTAAIISMFFVKETLRVDKFDNGSSQAPPLSTWEVINSPGVPMVLFIYAIVGVLGYSFTAVLPVFWFTSIPLGGFGFAPKMISRFMALGGVSQAIWLLGFFPSFHRRIGTGGVFRVCAAIWPFEFAANPLGNLFLGQGWGPAFWSTYPVIVILGSGCAMAFTCVQLAVNDISPSPSSLGTLNGVALSLSSAVRAVTPALFTSIYATGVRSRIFGGQLAWIVMIGVTLVYGASLHWLPTKAEGKLAREHYDTEEEH